MGLLSNILGFRDGHRADASLDVRLAREDEVEPAMRVILAPPGGGAADARVVQDFIAYGRERGAAFDGLHVAVKGGKIVSALLPVISPGRTVLLLAPSGAQHKATDAGTRQLVAPMCAYCAGRELALAQTLVDPQDPALEQAFVDEGFARMAELYYLQAHPPAGAAAATDLPAGLSSVTYGADNHAEFGRAILDSYQDSLDCPALNGRRDIEDILAGHKASGAFDPTLWFLLRDDASGRSLGVLLLGHSPRGDAMELVYLGLSPGARGRRLGEVMMRRALAAVVGRGLARLCLAVDARNTPALKLYYRHGMQRIGSKLALLRDLRPASGDAGVQKAAELSGNPIRVR